MNTDTATEADRRAAREAIAPALPLPATSPEDVLPGDPAVLPTTPCSVVWSGRHAYVLEWVLGRNRWVGVDDRGRAVALSCADLQRQGWRPTR
ncbi:MAG TPA: hypothetical protein VG756_30345 [Pseudonocardiaceae bacterium]|jgi:hypothetical protein|nr:hypothetical protein [Pseudonocardiaceae bacterium]